MNDHDYDNPSELDRATARRLGRLRGMPVELHRVEAHVRAATGLPRRRQAGVGRMLRPVGALAASVLVALAIWGGIAAMSGGQAMASPAVMAAWHRDLVEGRAAVTRVDSIEEAGAVLSGKGADNHRLPERPPEAHVMACCLQSVDRTKVSCVLLNVNDVPVTMSVADAGQMRGPRGGQVVERDGVSYRIERHGDLIMVSAERDGRWVCLIGQKSVDDLLRVASQLRF